MSLNSFIISKLTPTNVPVRWQKYTGPQTTYITFFGYNEQGVLFGDDVELAARHSIQVDIWSLDDYTDLAKQTKELLLAAGFVRNSGGEFYEDDTKVHHKVYRFY